MHKEPEAPGAIIKAARQRANITMEKLAERLEVTERYLYRIENEGQKPSYDVLWKLIWELPIDPRDIFNDKNELVDDEMETMLRMLHRCDPRSLAVIKATIRALLDTASE